jgi:hypothetical protein
MRLNNQCRSLTWIGNASRVEAFFAPYQQEHPDETALACLLVFIIAGKGDMLAVGARYLKPEEEDCWHGTDGGLAIG